MTVADLPAPRLADLVAELSRPRGLGVLFGRLVSLGAPGRGIARLARAGVRLRWPTTRFTRFHGRLLRVTRGRMRQSWLFAAGQPVMALTTVGRRSGHEHTTAVTAFCHHSTLACAAMNLGLERDPGWSHNLKANPEAWISLRGKTVPIRARSAAGAEWSALWRRWVQVQPSVEVFAQLAGRHIPIFVLEPREELDKP
jgi:deazaflavin-dependent oxidoreductase (nitroreductase family)